MLPIHVNAKAKAFVDALSKLPPSLYAAMPSGHYGRDYDLLYELALEVRPPIDERLLGKRVAITTLGDGRNACDASFAEIETYARQIMEQLSLKPKTEATQNAEQGPPLVTSEPPAKAYTVQRNAKKTRKPMHVGPMKMIRTSEMASPRELLFRR